MWNGEEVVSKELLEEKIAQANQNKKTVKISDDGKNVPKTEEWITEENLIKFQNAISEAQKLVDNDEATQKLVDSAVDELERATQSFNNSKLIGIQEESVEVVLEKIEITQQPTKTKYTTEDTQLDVIGLEVTGTYSDKSTKIEAISLDNISRVDFTTEGTKEVTITINGKIVSFNIEVEKIVEDIVAEISNVSSTNGELTIILDKAPTVDPLAEDFKVLQKVNNEEEKSLELINFLYNKESKTITFDFAEVLQTNEEQKIAISVIFREGNPKSTSYIIDAKAQSIPGETKENPILISTVQDLKNLNNNNTEGKYYKLKNNINLNNELWSPLNFDGSLDGDMFIIDNLKIEDSSSSTGLIKNLKKGAVLENIHLRSVNIKGGSTNTGGLVGRSDGTIVNCSVARGTITSTGDTGGIAGISTGTIKGSYSTVNISTTKTAGGLLGTLSSGTILNSYATGIVTSTGKNTTSGGLIGQASGKVENSYAVGKVTGDYSGGLVGYIPVGLKLTTNNSYYDLNTTTKSDTDKGKGITTEEMKQESSYVNWNASIWNFNSEYPNLNWQNTIEDDLEDEEIVEISSIVASNGQLIIELDKQPLIDPTVEDFKANKKINNGEAQELELTDFKYEKENKRVTVKFTEVEQGDVPKEILISIIYKDRGAKSSQPYTVEALQKDGEDGTAENPYTVSSVEQFKNLKNAQVNEHYKLSDNIDLLGETWIPFEFVGILDGDVYEVKNLSLKGSYNSVGLFNKLSSEAKIENIKLVNINIENTRTNAPSGMNPNTTGG